MWLLAGNVLVALAIDTHEFHERVRRWFDSQSEPFATCAITEGTLLRIHMERLRKIAAPPLHGRCLKRFIPCRIIFSGTTDSAYREVSSSGLTGLKQVTDAWLAELARRHEAQLATLDTGPVALHSDVGFLVP